MPVSLVKKPLVATPSKREVSDTENAFALASGVAFDADDRYGEKAARRARFERRRGREASAREFLDVVFG